jgi:uncharacterized protein (TIGR02145 family)
MNKDLILRLITLVITVSMALIPAACKKSETPVTTSTVPLAITTAAEGIGRNWATLKGQINGKNLMTTVTFQYDTVSTYTHTVSPSPDTTSLNKNVVFYYNLTGLRPSTKYYYRIYALSEGGTAKGEEMSFTTTDSTGFVINFNSSLVYDSIYDFEGNKYKTIVIGAQTWMAENLRSVKYNDGTDIPFIQDTYQWKALTTPGYCWYNSDSIGYGALYNWFTVNTGKLCPEGWHVPSDDEWTTLTDFLGGANVAGGKLKEVGTDHWLKPNTGATNESGFTAIPAGFRNYSGIYSNIGHYGVWWSTTEWSSLGAWFRDVYSGYESVDRSNSSKISGATVRCLKD